jgi:hypothetical protein
MLHHLSSVLRAFAQPSSNATEKALRAFALVGKTVTVTQRMAVEIEHASLSYVSALSCMSDAERARVRSGDLKLARYVEHRWRRPVIDLDALVAAHPDLVREALDRVALPPPPLAGNGAAHPTVVRL